MRRPSIHRVLNVPGSPGLSEVLVGTKTLAEVTLPTDTENLFVVPAGAIPPNPAELLGSRRFDEVIRELEEQCDVVLFDSPPCIPVTDPLIIAARMDGVVLVLHQGQTKKGAIKHVEELLARARARLIGVIFNRVQQGKGGYYYYHYYYYYGDGYYADTANRGERQRGGRSGRNGKGLLTGARGASSREEGLTPRYDPGDEG
jgi:capsular exopolysaccharide synthesis family protein